MTIEGKGKQSDTKTLKAYLGHIEHKSHLIHDDEKSHNILVKTLELDSQSYSSIYLNSLKDKDNPLNRMNHICFLLKDFLNQYSRFNRDELQGYLNLFIFMMNPPHEPLMKVKLLLEKALNTSKTLHFRDYYHD